MEEREFERRVRACTPRLFRVCYAILPERADRDDAIPDLALHNALQGLELKLRMPVVLHYAEGYTMAETARLLGIPVGTAKHRLERAKTILKEQLKEE